MEVSGQIGVDGCRFDCGVTSAVRVRRRRTLRHYARRDHSNDGGSLGAVWGADPEEGQMPSHARLHRRRRRHPSSSRVVDRLLCPCVVIPAPTLLRIAKRHRDTADVPPRVDVISKETLGRDHGSPSDGIRLLRLVAGSVAAVSAPAPSTSVWQVSDLGDPAAPFHRDLLWLPRGAVDRAGPLLTRCLLGDPPGRSQIVIGSTHPPAHQRSLSGKDLGSFIHLPQSVQVGELPVCEQRRPSRGFVSVARHSWPRAEVHPAMLRARSLNWSRIQASSTALGERHGSAMTPESNRKSSPLTEHMRTTVVVAARPVGTTTIVATCLSQSGLQKLMCSTARLEAAKQWKKLQVTPV
ncbi:hypothetical protein YWIDRAFT_06712 [Streptomyces sp. SceaMP-e96]|nr:hypothetical protein YWIDRAFT_06712 [Streptomyces sp. SceaMP-e96]